MAENKEHYIVNTFDEVNRAFQRIGQRLDEVEGLYDYNIEKGIYVTNSNGAPNISNEYFNVDDGVVEQSWESVGPSGSVADNLWAALDLIPADTEWVLIKASSLCNETGGTPGDPFTFKLYARKNGSTQGIGGATTISGNQVYANSSGDAYAYTSNIHPVAVNDRKFDIYWFSTFTSNTILLRLIGYGKN